MITLEQAIETINTNVKVLASEPVPLAESLNRVLREDVISDIDMPPFDKSAVDGYACRKAEIRNELNVIGTLAAGSQSRLAIGKNQCAKIMTGAAMPSGADCVLLIEHVAELSEKRIRFNGETTSANICFKGEDVVAGDKLVRSGTRIAPREIASLALAGYGLPLVSKKPRVGIVATGDEIVEPSVKPNQSQIRNSNSYQLIAHAQQFGCEVAYYGIAEDSNDAIGGIIAKSSQESDLLLITGGVSMGDLDLVPSLLEQGGFKTLFHGVSIQPGRPTIFGKSRNKFVFGIPGNPVASFVVFETLIKELLATLMGLKGFRRIVGCRLASDLKRQKVGRLGWRPVKIDTDGNAIPLEYHGTAHITAYIEADGMVSIPIGVEKIPEGSIVSVHLI